MMRFTAAKFPLGRVVMTTGAYDALTAADMKIGLFWHSQGYWGDLSDEDKAENDFSVPRRLRIVLTVRTPARGTHPVRRADDPEPDAQRRTRRRPTLLQAPRPRDLLVASYAGLGGTPKCAAHEEATLPLVRNHKNGSTS